MSSNRRAFLKGTSAAATAIALGPISRALPAEELKTSPVTELGRVRAKPVALNKVRLTGGPLKNAQEADAKYLMSLDPDRMMAFYRIRAGLTPKNNAQGYPGWDGAGRNLTGHYAGHHLSAVSLMYAATGDARFKQRADYLVAEMREVQDKNGDGYLSALENGREAFGALSKGDIRSAAFDLNGLWSPWYTLHKTFAGLRDAYRHTGNKTALDVETKFAGWAERTLAPLSNEQLARMLNTEHGGMNEVLADLYLDTGDKRWLDLSYKFEHHAFTDPLKRHQDDLPGKHGNCQIPKLVGSAARYEYTGDPGDLTAAAFFWDRVAQHHSYATGGHGLAEYFGFPDVLSTRVDGRTCESCNVYNMLKLTRRLFSFRPDPIYADFHERALFNHALASFDPDGIRMSYMVPVGRATEQEYQGMYQSMTCCMGTGMENHALHGDGIYYESEDTVWVNLYAPSVAELSNGIGLTMDSSFPDGDSAKLTLRMPRERTFTLAVRRPAWAGDGFAIAVNGQSLPQPTLASFRVGGAGGRDVGFDSSVPQTSSYVEITRAWKTGDVVELSLPKTVHLQPTPDDPTVAAVMWGPLVLAGDLAPRREGRGAPRVPAPVLIGADRPVTEWIKPSTGRQGDFRAVNVARTYENPTGSPTDVALTPFYRTHGRTYSVYFDVLTPQTFEAHLAGDAAGRERQRQIDAATISKITPGDASLEQEYNYKTDPADRALIRTGQRTARGGTGWFSYDLPVAPNAATVMVTYFNDLGLPVAGEFSVSVDGTVIGHYEPNRTAPGFWDASYPMPANLVGQNARATIRFDALNGSRIAPVYAIRILK